RSSSAGIRRTPVSTPGAARSLCSTGVTPLRRGGRDSTVARTFRFGSVGTIIGRRHGMRQGLLNIVNNETLPRRESAFSLNKASTLNAWTDNLSALDLFRQSDKHVTASFTAGPINQ